MDNRGINIFTIGHSNHSFDFFLRLLKEYDIEILVDIRSHPYSKFSPQFDIRNIKKEIKYSGIKYLYLGKELGGKPKGKEFYESDGKVNYAHLADLKSFREGLQRLENGSQKYRVAIMCSEENPANCHRKLLVGRILIEHGFILNHIRGNGQLEKQSELEINDANGKRDFKNHQLSLF
jgi:uncharacterized protein (DUF488 family)